MSELSPDRAREHRQRSVLIVDDEEELRSVLTEFLQGQGLDVIQAANDARAEADHATLAAVHRLTVDIHSINETQTVILDQLRGAR